jgi:hypothetical protein
MERLWMARYSSMLLIWARSRPAVGGFEVALLVHQAFNVVAIMQFSQGSDWSSKQAGPCRITEGPAENFRPKATDKQ